MKLARLIVAVTVLAAAGSWTVSYAGKDRSAQASGAAHATCTAEMAKNCTPEQAAACKAKGAKAGTGECPYHSGASATTAAMSAEHSAGKGAVAVGSDALEGKAAAGSSATCQHGKSAKAAATPMSGAAGAVTAGAVTAGASCLTRGTSTAAGSSGHAGCDACADMVRSEDELSAMGASVQTVALKNGVMFVYTADSPSRVRGMQTALTRRNERMEAMTTAGDKAKLCPECKALRGAAASGKLQREVVSIEGGCLALMTSDDPAVVAKIHAMVGVQTAARVKS